MIKVFCNTSRLSLPFFIFTITLTANSNNLSTRSFFFSTTFIFFLLSFIFYLPGRDGRACSRPVSHMGYMY